MPTAEEAARSSVLVVDAPERGTLRVNGPDRLGWLNGIVTGDVSKVAPGQGVHSLILSKTGKVMSDLFVVAAPEVVFVSVAPGKAAELHGYLDKMLVMEDAEVSEETADHVWIMLHGPEAVGVGGAVAEQLGGASGALDWTGLGGAALVVRRDALAAAHAAITVQEPRAVHATAADWELLRLERGVATYDVDFGLTDNPHEAGLDQRAVSWSKGCYLGQEVVCMQGMRGKLKRRLVSLTLAGSDVPARGAPVELAGGTERVGEITSAAASVRVGAVVALARVDGAALDAAAPLVVGGVPATLVARPDPG